MKKILFVFSLMCMVATVTAQDVATMSVSDIQEHRAGKLLMPDGGLMVLGTTKTDYGQGMGDIFFAKKNAQGSQVWLKTFGGTSYERAGSFKMTSDGGFIIVASTSSMGNGNYDVYLIKTDAEGNEVWSSTFGAFYNEYGYLVEENADGSFTVNGKKQQCASNTDASNCKDYVWELKVNSSGAEISNEVKGLYQI